MNTAYRFTTATRPAPPWKVFLDAGRRSAKDDDAFQDFLRGVWQSLEPKRDKDGQYVMALSKDADELKERRDLVKDLMDAGTIDTISAPVGAG